MKLLESDAKKARAFGRGLQAKGVRIGDKADFKIETTGAGKGQLDVKVLGPGIYPNLTGCSNFQKNFYHVF